jgi:hypothetical protein
MRIIESLQNHVIICGASNIGRISGLYFTRAQQDFIIVEADEDRLRRALLYLDAEYLRKKFGGYYDIANAVDVTEDEQSSLEKLASKVNIPYLLADPTEDSTLIAAGISRAHAQLDSVLSRHGTGQQSVLLSEPRRSDGCAVAPPFHPQTGQLAACAHYDGSYADVVSEFWLRVGGVARG